MRHRPLLIAILAAFALPALADETPKKDEKERRAEPRIEKPAAEQSERAAQPPSADTDSSKYKAGAGATKLPAVRPEQSSAERTADPHPLEHDKPTGEPTR